MDDLAVAADRSRSLLPASIVTGETRVAEQRDAREIAAEWLHDQLTDEDAGPWREATEWVREWWATNLADPLLAVLAAGGWSVERLDPAGVGLYDLSDPDRPRRVMVPLYRVISPSTREAESDAQ